MGAVTASVDIVWGLSFFFTGGCLDFCPWGLGVVDSMVGDGALLCVYAVDASMSIEIMGYEHSPCDIALLS